MDDYTPKHRAECSIVGTGAEMVSVEVINPKHCACRMCSIGLANHTALTPEGAA